MPRNLGTYLRELRKSRELSLRSVEGKTGLSNSYLSQLESGKIAKPSPQVLHTLSEVYGEDYMLLMTLAGYPVPRDSLTKKHGSIISHRASTGTNHNMSLEEDLADLTEEEQKKVWEYMEFLRSRRRKSP